MAYQLTQVQGSFAATALGQCDNLNANYWVQMAILYAAMGESDLGKDAGTWTGGGVWQDLYSPDPEDVANEAYAWLTGKYGFHMGGGINCYNTYSHEVWVIANSVEDNLVWSQSHGDSYVGSWYGGRAGGYAAAESIIAQYRAGVYGKPAGWKSISKIPAPPSVTSDPAPDLAVPTVQQYDVSPIIRNAFWQLGVHGKRAYDNAVYLKDLANGVTYVDTSGYH